MQASPLPTSFPVSSAQRWPTPEPLSSSGKPEEFDNGLAGPGAIIGGAGLALIAKEGLDRFYGQIDLGSNPTDKPGKMQQSPLGQSAHWLDKQPGFKQFNQWLETHQPKLLHDRTWETVLNHRSPAEVEKALLRNHLDALSTWYETVLPRKLKDFDTNPATKARAKKLIQAVKTHLDPQKLDRLDQLEPALAKVKGALAENELSGEEVLKRLGPAPKMLTGLERRLLTRLKESYLPAYNEEYALLKQMKLKPIGRTLVSATTVLRRVINSSVLTGIATAETSTLSGSSKNIVSHLWSIAGKHFGKYGGALTSGLLIFAPAFNAAQKADSSERGKAFWKGLLGIGLGNFLGWELGLALLNKTQWVTHALNRIRPGLALAPVIGLTVGGLVTELLALNLGGKLVEKLGEGVSRVLFGPVQSDPLAKMREEGKPVPSIVGRAMKWSSFTASSSPLPPTSEIPTSGTDKEQKGKEGSLSSKFPKVGESLSQIPNDISSKVKEAKTALPGLLPLGLNQERQSDPRASSTDKSGKDSQDTPTVGVALSPSDLEKLMNPKSGLER